MLVFLGSGRSEDGDLPRFARDRDRLDRGEFLVQDQEFARRRVGEEQRLTMPRQALAQRGEVSAVYVVEDGKVSLRQVRPGRSEGEAVEILAGLEPGETVALDPIKAGVYLKDQSSATTGK